MAGKTRGKQGQATQQTLKPEQDHAAVYATHIAGHKSCDLAAEPDYSKYKSDISNLTG